jgi:hypothetical protein
MRATVCRELERPGLGPAVPRRAIEPASGRTCNFSVRQ